MKQNQHALMDSNSAAAYLQLSPNTLAVWRSTGRNGPRYKKCGSRVRYAVSDLDKWLSDQTYEHTAKRASNVN